MADEKPAHGVRVVLARTREEGAQAEYAVTLSGPEGTFDAKSMLRAGESPSLEVDGAPAWMVDSALAFLRILARDAGRGEGWPPRLTRWRGKRG